jgi:SsrA-binding protein
MPKAETPGKKIIAVNKKARHEYEFIETMEAGLALTGSEVKSLRDGHVSFKDGYVRFDGGQAFLVGVHIAPYSHAGLDQHDPERPRKLLLHAREIRTWQLKVDQRGLAVIPVRLYLVKGKIKLEIALARGKKTFDKKDDLKQRDLDRDMKRQLDRF